VGQKAITNTLLNAIESNHLPLPYYLQGLEELENNLRSYFRKINQPGYDDPLKILLLMCLNAASNNSVDDIRSLIDQVRIPPQTGKYKVYIIDEVHMLSSAAFNAFLKTLEEPPKHAIFILATTENINNSNYIIAMSNFDFKRITVKMLKNILLKWQLVKESFLKMMLFILSLRKQMVLCAMPHLFLIE
jgi:DNA polymerase-3 subunit gamma/tau